MTRKSQGRKLLDWGVALGVTTVSLVWWLKARKTSAEAQQRADQAGAQAAAAQAAAEAARQAADQAKRAADAAYGTSVPADQQATADMNADLLDQQARELERQAAATAAQARQ